MAELAWYFSFPVTAASPRDVTRWTSGWASWRKCSSVDLNEGALPGGIANNMFFLHGHRSNNQFSAASAVYTACKKKNPIPLDITHERAAQTSLCSKQTKPSFFFLQKPCHNGCSRFDSDVSQRNTDTVNLFKEIWWCVTYSSSWLWSYYSDGFWAEMQAKAFKPIAFEKPILGQSDMSTCCTHSWD